MGLGVVPPKRKWVWGSFLWGSSLFVFQRLSDGVAVDAAVGLGFGVGQAEDVGEFLLDRGDAAGVLAVEDVGDFLREFGVDFFDHVVIFDDVDGDLGVKVAQEGEVQVKGFGDLEDVLLALLFGISMLDEGNLAVQLVQAQVVVEDTALAVGDVVDDDAFL